MERMKWVKRAKELRIEHRKEFYECVKDLMENPIVRQMERYPHHGSTNCYQHCLHVAYYNYHICQRLGLNAKAAARAGMIHDLFLYDWHTYAARTGDYFHGLTHPKKVVKIAKQHFELSPLEEDIILKHMWPLTLVPPKYPESYVICLTDKYCGACEVFGHHADKIFSQISEESAIK